MQEIRISGNQVVGSDRMSNVEVDLSLSVGSVPSVAMSRFEETKPILLVFGPRMEIERKNKANSMPICRLLAGGLTRTPREKAGFPPSRE